MATRKNPLKLNKLQLRTLALAQVLARDPRLASTDEETGDVALLELPQPHGDHVHIGDFVVSTREASGFRNPAVWRALGRKGLARTDDPITLALTPAGLSYDTGHGERFAPPADH